jgi:phosphate starvation-inducible PhoH-like protein
MRNIANVVPKNLNQQKYVTLMHKTKPYIVIASGPSGSGKTLLATHTGIEKLKDGVIDRLIITRPTVAVGGDDLGFLPGTLQQKLEPWVRPIYDVLMLHYTKNTVEKMIKDGTIELAALTHMRGRTFTRSWIICDEAQNTTVNQMLMVLTRIGSNSKLIITGDPQQHDRGYDINGFTDLIQRVDFNQPSDIELVRFESTDVERHAIIPIILSMYK